MFNNLSGFDVKTLTVVAVGALLIYAVMRWRNGQPTLLDTLNDAMSHPKPVHKTPVEHIVDKCVPKPPSPEELRAVVDAHHAKTDPTAASKAPSPVDGSPASTPAVDVQALLSKFPGK